MCGIAGIIRNDECAANDPGVVFNMLETLKHRGPDHTGEWHSEKASLGSTRLAIVGLKSGNQPIFNEDKTLILVCNGEIFNYVELREQLLAKGHIFSTDTDVEVLIHLYEDGKTDFLASVNGQFAFAIYEVKNHRLTIARDRTGICPLFYYSSDQFFSFASEIKALFKISEIPRYLSPENIYDTISLWSVTPPFTVFDKIFQVNPGEMLILDNGKLDRHKYWNMRLSDDLAGESFESLCRMVRQTMKESVFRHLRADVPVGLYLSGGIDSSILASLAAERLGNSLHTFSIGFEDETYDESSFQRLMSEHVGAKHYHFQCRYRDIAQAFPEVIKHAETVLFRCAPVPLFYLSKAVHEIGYKTVTSGEGADEVFWGYDTYRELFIRLMWARNPSSEWRPRQLRKIFPYFVQYQNDRYFNFLKSFYKKTLSDTENPFYSHLPRWSTNTSNLDLLSDDVKQCVGERDFKKNLLDILPEEFSSWDHFRKCQSLEMITLLAGYLLSSQGDRMIMSHSVEGRFPFLDTEVLKLTSAIPNKWKCKGLHDKYILREAFKEDLPEAIYKRPKFAYRAPDMKSFYKSEWKPDYVDELMSEEYTKKVGIFDPQKTSLLHKKGLTANLDNVSTKDDMAVTSILSTHMLYYTFIEKN